MADKFMFYENFLNAIEQLDDDMKADACLALCRYGVTGELPENQIFRFFCIGVSASVQKYDGRGGKRENSGRKSNNDFDYYENQKNQKNQKNQNFQKQQTETETETETETILSGSRKSATPDRTKKACRFENSEFCKDTLPESFSEESKKQGFKGSAEREYQSFRDYWIAKSGAAATKLDWRATWRNWLRNSEKYGGQGGAVVNFQLEESSPETEEEEPSWRELARRQGINV